MPRIGTAAFRTTTPMTCTTPTPRITADMWRRTRRRWRIPMPVRAQRRLMRRRRPQGSPSLHRRPMAARRPISRRLALVVGIRGRYSCTRRTARALSSRPPTRRSASNGPRVRPARSRRMGRTTSAPWRLVSRGVGIARGKVNDGPGQGWRGFCAGRMSLG